jgi:NitT/TauT family transport system substrate-binding protein
MKRLTLLLSSALLLAALAACGATSAPTAATGGASAAPAAAAGTTGGPTAVATRGTAIAPATPTRSGGPLRKLTIGLGYVPDIQFAPFYVAQARGYFRDEGLDVEFQQSSDGDVLKLIGTGALTFGLAGGEEVLIARSQGVPVTSVGTLYQKYPVTVAALERANIRTVADLKGRTIGVPGRYGATYVGLLALLDSAGLKESDVRLREIGFTQVGALTQGQVEAIVGYTNNEPVQLRALGEAITTINVFDRVNLVSNGLVADEKTLGNDPELVRAVVRATLRGVRDTIADPDAAVSLSVPLIPGASDKRAQLRAVLDATLLLLQSDQMTAHGLGYGDPAIWSSSRDLLLRLKLLGGDIDLAKTFSNAYLPTK